MAIDSVVQLYYLSFFLTVVIVVGLAIYSVKNYR
jgi:hypothetical protein